MGRSTASGPEALQYPPPIIVSIVALRRARTGVYSHPPISLCFSLCRPVTLSDASTVWPLRARSRWASLRGAGRRRWETGSDWRRATAPELAPESALPAHLAFDGRPSRGGALCVTAHSAPPMAAVGGAVGSVDGLGRTRNPRSFTCLRAATPCVGLGTGAAVAAAFRRHARPLEEHGSRSACTSVPGRTPA